LGGGDGADFGLIGPGGNNDGDGRLAHEAKAKGREELETGGVPPNV
jgi:hypothetical protein